MQDQLQQGQFVYSWLFIFLCLVGFNVNLDRLMYDSKGPLGTWGMFNKPRNGNNRVQYVWRISMSDASKA